MCYSCWTGDYGAPMTANPDVLAAAELIRRLYDDLGQATGGPLHAMLDDLNVADDYVAAAKYDPDELYAYLWDGRFERWAQAGDDTSVAHREKIEQTCRNIVKIFWEIPVSHRVSAIGWFEGWPQLHLSTVVADQITLGRGNGAPFATVTEIADVLARIEQGHGPKACAVPCPPFQEVTLHDQASGCSPEAASSPDS